MNMNYLIDTAGALIGPVEFPVIPGLGAQLPDNAVALDQELPAPGPGCVWAFIEGRPKETLDLRGVVYSTETGEPLTWSELGALPDTVTSVARPGAYFVWTDSAWQLDQQAQLAAAVVAAQNERDVRLREASMRIAPLQYAVDLGDATPQEQSALLDWKRYCVALNRIEQQAGYPLEVEWPILTSSEPKEPTNSLLSLFGLKQK
ncbi:tail fiber assembly protein [Pseudomonas fluorescens]|uniref:tail fiber assembly protein n=1 Tax=Pseudomonas TaxID=286 RepID=UPI003D08A6E7